MSLTTFLESFRSFEEGGSPVRKRTNHEEHEALAFLRVLRGELVVKSCCFGKGKNPPKVGCRFDSSPLYFADMKKSVIRSI
jgi:hypothetical protein